MCQALFVCYLTDSVLQVCMQMVSYTFFSFRGNFSSARLSSLLKIWTKVWITPHFCSSLLNSVILYLTLFLTVVFNFQASDQKFLFLFGEFSTLWVLVRNRAFLLLYQVKISDTSFTLFLSVPYSWKTVRWPRIAQLHPCPRFWIRNKWCEKARAAVPGSASCVLFLLSQQGKPGHITSLWHDSVISIG